MPRIGLVMVAATAAATGCATLPELPTQRSVSVTEVVRAIQCELKAAYEATAPTSELRTWDAGFKLTLAVEEKAGAAASAGFDVVVSGDDTLVPGFSLGADSTAKRSVVVEFATTYARLRSVDCAAGANSAEMTGWDFRGNLGIGEWLSEVERAFVENKASSPTAVSYGNDFILKLSGGLALGFEFAPVEAAVGGGGSREDTHTLSLALAPPKKAPAAAQGSPEVRQLLQNQDILLQLDRLTR
jgi:hypothetical protein